MRRRPAIALAALAVIGLMAAGCGSSSGTEATGHAGASTSSGSFPVTVGGITLATKPTHIISLSATATDMLFSIGAGAQVVEVDKYSTYFGANPPAATPPADIDAYTANAESIAAKNPDLVVMASDTNKISDQLAKLNIPVYMAPAAATVEDTYQQETDLGRLTGHADGAAATVTAEKKQISDVLSGLPSRSKQLSYYYELDQTLYSVTSKTFIGSLFTMANMVNIADTSANGTDYPQLTPEAVIKANPDLIFLADTDCCQQTTSTVAKRPGWSSISAVSGHRVIALDDSVASQWGTRVPQLLAQIVDADKTVPVS